MSDDIKLMVFKIEFLIYDSFISGALIKKDGLLIYANHLKVVKSFMKF